MDKYTNAHIITKEAKKREKKNHKILCKITLMLLLQHISVLSEPELKL